jgi:two-component system chemotaxis response regulator CheB
MEAVVIGSSAGGLEACKEIFRRLPANFNAPILLVQHMHAMSDAYFVKYLNQLSPVRVKEAEEKESIEPGTVYVAPPNYHLLVDDDRTIALSVDQKVNYSRPSIDVLFESAAEVYRENLLGIILTGANHDGTQGMQKIKQNGGMVIVQDPETAEVATMPMSVIRQVQVDHILENREMAPFLIKLFMEEMKHD